MDFSNILMGGAVIVTVGVVIWAFWKAKDSPPDIKASDVGLLAAGMQDPSLAVSAYTAGKALQRTKELDQDDLDVSVTTVFENLSMNPEVEIDEDSDSDFLPSMRETEKVRISLDMPDQCVDTGTSIVSMPGADGWLTEEPLTKEEVVKCWGCESCNTDKNDE